MSESSAVSNIGDLGVSRRLGVGWVGLVVGIGLGVAFIETGQPRTVRLLVFVPFWLAALGFAQAQARTCLSLAARGVKDLDDGKGPVPLTDDTERRAIDARARGIHARALGLAVALTLMTVFVPGPRSHP
jgi:hypothetical protein